ncbi:MAG: hypothetical protein ACLP7Q_12820 [Isosphaeraceae bacterium]
MTLEIQPRYFALGPGSNRIAFPITMRAPWEQHFGCVWFFHGKLAKAEVAASEVGLRSRIIEGRGMLAVMAAAPSALLAWVSKKVYA